MLQTRTPNFVLTRGKETYFPWLHCEGDGDLQLNTVSGMQHITVQNQEENPGVSYPKSTTITFTCESSKYTSRKKIIAAT